MGQSNRLTSINHSSILFIPGVGSLLYKLQFYLYQRRLIKNLLLSRKKNSEREKLLRLISNQSKYVICKSYKFGRILKDLKPPIIADFQAPDNIKKLSLKRLHEISWTLILTSMITSRTKRSLAKFVPKNFPEADIKLL